jgi:pyruvate,orthophosphate dikinase
MGKTCVCGAEELDVDTARAIHRWTARLVHEGDVISIDGTTGEVYLGAVPVVRLRRWCSTSRAR